LFEQGNRRTGDIEILGDGYLRFARGQAAENFLALLLGQNRLLTGQAKSGWNNFSAKHALSLPSAGGFGKRPQRVRQGRQTAGGRKVFSKFEPIMKNLA
jgi:hypothetical protein